MKGKLQMRWGATLWFLRWFGVPERSGARTVCTLNPLESHVFSIGPLPVLFILAVPYYPHTIILLYNLF